MPAPLPAAPPPPGPSRPAPRAPGPELGAAVALVTLALFAPALRLGFIAAYDDEPYVLFNETVRRGLHGAGVAWAFAGAHVSNWHPLTWLSHMLDVSLFGVAPWGHHLTSVLLHAGCAALVFALARACGAGAWASAFAALAFGVHPLRVQSVAWVAERKDVLSGLLGLAALLLWIRWARGPTRARYAAALASFALGLLAKPMLVSLPAVLLLLDVWPLRRTGDGGPGVVRRVLEKVPFALLAAASAVVTLAAQASSGAIQSGDAFPLPDRLAGAAVAPFLYLGKTVWPASLSVFYPHRGAEIPAAVAVLGAGALVAVTAAAWRLRGRAPFLLVGWGWFLVMLLPVLGLVQAGRQGMADRYTYLPAVGLVLALAAGGEIAVRAAGTRAARAAAALAVAVLAALAAVTTAQVPLWRDGETLFRHAVEVTGANAVAENALGVLAARAGRLDEAAGHYARAAEADPGFGIARQNLAAILLARGLPAQAAPHAEAAVRLLPASPQARYVHAGSLASQGRLLEALGELEATLALRPDYPGARAALQQVRAELGMGPPAPPAATP